MNKPTQLDLFSEIIERKKITPDEVANFLKNQRENEPEPKLTMLSFGGGQDSFAILYKLIHDLDFRNKYAPNDFFVAMSDTGNEHPHTYKAVKEAEELCKKNNIDFKFITKEMGYHTPGWQDLISPMQRNEMILGASLSRQPCTINLKINVMDKYMYEYMCNLYGFNIKPSKVPNKNNWELYRQKFQTKARVLIGFAKDEETRVLKTLNNGGIDYGAWKRKSIQYVYPLLEEGWNRQSAQDIISMYGKLMPPSNCMICFYQSEQELVWLERNYPEMFQNWVELERAKVEKWKKLGQPDNKNFGVYGVKLLPQKLADAKEKYGSWSDEQLNEYKMSHGHCVKSAF
jgi:hypothetical protein